MQTRSHALCGALLGRVTDRQRDSRMLKAFLLGVWDLYEWSDPFLEVLGECEDTRELEQDTSCRWCSTRRDSSLALLVMHRDATCVMPDTLHINKNHRRLKFFTDLQMVILNSFLVGFSHSVCQFRTEFCQESDPTINLSFWCSIGPKSARVQKCLHQLPKTKASGECFLIVLQSISIFPLVCLCRMLTPYTIT